MKNYFRIQQRETTLMQMQKHISGDGGDGGTKGLCACETVGDLLHNTAFENFGRAVVYVLHGNKVCDIYDGVRITPTEIVAVFSYDEFKAKVSDGSIYDYETL
jgi:hypothetical protein